MINRVRVGTQDDSDIGRKDSVSQRKDIGGIGFLPSWTDDVGILQWMFNRCGQRFGIGDIDSCPRLSVEIDTEVP